MNGKIKFSIMTPVYKVEDFLGECIESVLGQSYENFELILVDDGSPDRSGEICEEYAEKDGRIRVFHKPNAGLVHTRSYALARAEGDYYVFLDSDDWLEPGTLETLYGKICESGGDCVIYGVQRVCNGRATERISCEKEIDGALFTDKRTVYNIIFLGGGYNSLCRKCVKADCFDGRDYSGYYGISLGEDLVRSLEVLENAESFLFISDILYNYRYNTESMMRSINYDETQPDNEVPRMVTAYLNRAGVFTQEDWNRLHNVWLQQLMIEMRRVARGCSSEEKAAEVMERHRADPFNEKLLAGGYRRVPRCLGQEKIGALRRLAFKINIALFKRRRYRSFLLFDKALRRL